MNYYQDISNIGGREMTLDYLIIEIFGSKDSKKNMDSISKKLNIFFESINIDPLIFKEGKSKYSPWDFPESCEQEIKFLIEYINSAKETLKNIKANLIMVEDIEHLDFLISVIEKVLIAKGLSDKEIIEIKNKIYAFTNYRNLRLESSLNDIISDFKFITSTAENNLDLDEQLLFFEYSEREIKKLQEHLRLVYTSMNSEKSYYNLKCEANAIKESYGENSQNTSINTYIKNKIKLDNKVNSDEIYFNLVQEQLVLINKKISITTKKDVLAS